MKKTNEILLRRIGAFLVDWFIVWSPCVVYITIFDEIFLRPSFENMTHMVVLMLLIILAPVLIVLRDVIFAGRSIGKRLFHLIVLDKKTLQKATISQKLIRGLVFLIYMIDIIVLLVSKESLGDMLANTVVVKKEK